MATDLPSEGEFFSFLVRMEFERTGRLPSWSRGPRGQQVREYLSEGWLTPATPQNRFERNASRDLFREATGINDPDLEWFWPVYQQENNLFPGDRDLFFRAFSRDPGISREDRALARREFTSISGFDPFEDSSFEQVWAYK